MAMYSLSAVLQTCLVYIAFFTQVSEQVTCPQHKSDPSDVNTRIMKLAKQEMYYPKDKEYEYQIAICQKDDGNNVAIQQFGKNWDKNKRDWVTVGRYDNAVVKGGTDWVMITYPGGTSYHSHCGQVNRQGVLTITCDPGVTRGEVKIIEEFRTNATQVGDKVECYYLFELNHEAACSVPPKHLSAGSILLIILLVVGAIYIILGFLYQRFVVGAKGMEQIPNYNFWVNCGSLQADGCNFICRCAESQPTRYKTMDDVLADDDKDDTLLPM